MMAGGVRLGHVARQQDGHVVLVIVARREHCGVHRLVSDTVEARGTQEVGEGFALGGGQRRRGEDEAARLRIEVGRERLADVESHRLERLHGVSWVAVELQRGDEAVICAVKNEPEGVDIALEARVMPESSASWLANFPSNCSSMEMRSARRPLRPQSASASLVPQPHSSRQVLPARTSAQIHTVMML